MADLTGGAPQGRNAEPPKPESFAAGIRRIVTGNNEELDGSIVNETTIPFEVCLATNLILN